MERLKEFSRRLLLIDPKAEMDVAPASAEPERRGRLSVLAVRMNGHVMSWGGEVDRCARTILSPARATVHGSRRSRRSAALRRVLVFSRHFLLEMIASARQRIHPLLRTGTRTWTSWCGLRAPRANAASEARPNGMCGEAAVKRHASDEAAAWVTQRISQRQN